jgi:hypothetical protein
VSVTLKLVSQLDEADTISASQARRRGTLLARLSTKLLHTFARLKDSQGTLEIGFETSPIILVYGKSAAEKPAVLRVRNILLATALNRDHPGMARYAPLRSLVQTLVHLLRPILKARATADLGDTLHHRIEAWSRRSVRPVASSGAYIEPVGSARNAFHY